MRVVKTVFLVDHTAVELLDDGQRLVTSRVQHNDGQLTTVEGIGWTLREAIEQMYGQIDREVLDDG